MEFQSILFGAETPEIIKEEPDFFKDLQLDYVLEHIVSSVKGYETARYFYTFPQTKELIEYRQQIGKDMESEELCTVMRNFCRSLKESRKLHNFSLESKGEVQSATYYLQAATLYWEAVQKLFEELQEMQLSSEGMKEFTVYVATELASKREQGFEEALHQANRFFSELSFSLSLDSDKIIVTEYNESSKEGKREDDKKKEKPEPLKNYFVELAKLLNQEPDQTHAAMKDIFPDSLKPSYLEHELVGILKKSKPQVFQEIRRFQERYPEVYSKKLLCFEEEIQFYLSFQKFKIRTGGMGYPMENPQISEKQQFSGRGVYDLALVWKQSDSNYEVISNNFDMKKHPSFFVVTGPNQGGKTTFARSMGQAVYFTLMGLPANAENFCMPMLKGISTHFEAEETLQSNSGKLKEEINRLIPMMARVQNRNRFVILNELFTTATTHDAMLMGRKVMDSFLKRECYGIYVTHIQELAEETDAIISLVAQLEPGEETKRTYRMLPMKAQGYGYSDALVKKFQLEYEDIVRRLS